MIIHNDLIKKAAAHLKQGGVIVYPTETAYALGADATEQKAVDAIFKIKGRSKNKTLPMLAADLTMVKRYCLMSKEEEQAAKKYWPGPLTLVLRIPPKVDTRGMKREIIIKKQATAMKNQKGNVEMIKRQFATSGGVAFDGWLARGIEAKDRTAAFRVSAHPIARALSAALERPLVSTSANRAGAGECFSVAEVKKQLGGAWQTGTVGQTGNGWQKIFFIDGGILKKRKPSTVIKIEDGKIKVLRQGEIKMKR